MRRYFVKTKDGEPVASAEALKLWKTDEGRDWLYVSIIDIYIYNKPDLTSMVHRSKVRS